MWALIKRKIGGVLRDELPDLVESGATQFVKWLRVWASRP